MEEFCKQEVQAKKVLACNLWLHLAMLENCIRKTLQVIVSPTPALYSFKITLYRGETIPHALYSN